MNWGDKNAFHYYGEPSVHWILTLTARELILVSFKPSWHADFRTALRILVHGSQNF